MTHETTDPILPAMTEDTNAPDGVEITQADREAAADYYEDWHREKTLPDFMRKGMADNSRTIQAFARHRIASQADLVEALEFLFEKGDVQIQLAGNPIACDALEAKCRAALAKAKGGAA